MKGDASAFVYVICIFQHVPTTYKGGATASVHCIGDIHTAFAREDALEIHIEPGDAHSGGSDGSRPVKLGGDATSCALNSGLAGNAVETRHAVEPLFVIDILLDDVGENNAADVSLFA